MRRLRLLYLLLILITASAAAACSQRLRIVDRPISFSPERQALTREYMRDRYGIVRDDISITPRMVVLHWTAIDDVDASFRAFNAEKLAARPELAGAGSVNVSIQFLVGRDGTVYRLMPETWMARHVIGLNHAAIGVENVGGADGVENLTPEQVAANVALIRYLKERYPTIEYLIGHHEYERFEGHPLWLERDPAYRTPKIDPGAQFMDAVRSGVTGLGLRGAPADVQATVPKPEIVPHSAWEAHAPVGHDAVATRRNLAPGDSIAFRDLHVTLHSMQPAAGDKPASAVVTLRLRADGEQPITEQRTVAGGSAFNWNGWHIAVLAVNAGDTGLGAGLVELEAGLVSSIPAHIAASTVSGDATHRLRVRHDIHTITLHHTGSAEPLRPADDPAAKLRGLQVWGQRDRNWWDVPYHYLIDLDGRIYQGRDHRYMGETNTRYNPEGHFLISVLGNYDVQEPTPQQVRAVADMMAWAVSEFGVPVDRIHGHGELTTTSCPGRTLRPLLDDGTFRREVLRRLER